MFEWLEEELRSIKTPRFHLIDGDIPPALRKAILESPVPVPPSYKQFVLKFGNAHLYRNSRIGYRIGVFASPREAKVKDGTRLLHVGFHLDASVYLKDSDTLKSTDGFPIFEFENNKEYKVACDFEEWLIQSAAL